MRVALSGQLPYQAHWIYFHGEAQDYADTKQRKSWHAPDLVSSDHELNSLPDGVYEVDMYERKAVLYLWTVPSSSSFYKTKGLIVFPETLAEDYAKKCYKLRQSTL